jgi:bifunctional glutamyl/prolyl-tRNA synthetase
LIPPSHKLKYFLPVEIKNRLLLKHSCFFSLPDQVDAIVKQLPDFKAEFHQITGKEYKLGMTPPSAAQAKTALSASSPSSSPSVLYERVTEQGDTVRKLKSEKSAKVRKTSSV